MSEAGAGPLVRVEAVRYRYRARRAWALDGVSLQVGRGVVLGLVGPNGSGKTTLYRLILGLLRPSAGQVKVGGSAPTAYRSRRGVGYLPERVNLPRGVRVHEFGLLMARLAGLRGAESGVAVERLMGALALEDRADDLIRTLSHGYTQRVGLLAALLGDPDLLLLDEPANGLDPISMGVLRSVLRSLPRRGKTVIVSSHNLLELERICDEVAVLSQGRLLGRATRADLVSRADVWAVRLAGESRGVAADLAGLCARLGGFLLAGDEAAFPDERTARDFAFAFAASGGAVAAIERRPFDLECLFHQLVQRRDEAERPAAEDGA